MPAMPPRLKRMPPGTTKEQFNTGMILAGAGGKKYKKSVWEDIGTDASPVFAP
jgi:hypothetical protein